MVKTARAAQVKNRASMPRIGTIVRRDLRGDLVDERAPETGLRKRVRPRAAVVALHERKDQKKPLMRGTCKKRPTDNRRKNGASRKFSPWCTRKG